MKHEHRRNTQVSRRRAGAIQEQPDGKPEIWLHPVVPERSQAVWAKDVYLRTLWENLLLNAASQPFRATFKGHEWSLLPGQLVVTAADLGLQLCDRKGNPTSRDSVERMLAVFVREGMISIEGEKQKGRVITITNFAEYAQKQTIYPHMKPHMKPHILAHMASPAMARV